MNPGITLTIIILLFVLIAASTEGEQKPDSNWNAPDRAQRVLDLRPGKRVPNLTPDTLFADWTKQQVERWQKDHPTETIADVCERAAVSTDGRFPSDSEITTDFPVQISPYGRVRSGKPDDPLKAERVLAAGPLACQRGYCPFCGSLDMSFNFDPANRHHASTTCCRKDIYDADYPTSYDLKPTETTGFPDLDGNIHQVPTVVYKDRDGIVWELYVANVFANKRWDDWANLCTSYNQAFISIADPAYAYKLAVILDKTADTYYGLLPSGINELCPGKDGKPLTRAEWEAVPRPCMFGPSYLREWSRRGPLFSRGWLRQVNEAIWGEPFARMRHHPAFKYYSQKVYGDPDALDRKVRQKLMREIAMTWESIGGGLITDYQDAIYTNELLVGALAERPAMLDFTAPGNELTLYNHYFNDGLCGEGAANYMAMPGGYYFAPLMEPQGTWLSLYPDFLKENPFLNTANTEWQKLRTLRGLELEFGDEHLYAFNGDILTDKAKVNELEKAPSVNWPGWGLGLLRVGGSGHRMEMTMDYTRVAQHTSSDPLGIACWVDGIPVMRPGGYGSGDPCLPFQKDRPEIKELQQIGYPKEIVEAKTEELAFGGWTHSPMAQNTITVNETFPSMGWQDNRGYGEVIAYKGGEKPGDPGARFQALEIRDRYI